MAVDCRGALEEAQRPRQKQRAKRAWRLSCRDWIAFDETSWNLTRPWPRIYMARFEARRASGDSARTCRNDGFCAALRHSVLEADSEKRWTGSPDTDNLDMNYKSRNANNASIDRRSFLGCGALATAPWHSKRCGNQQLSSNPEPQNHRTAELDSSFPGRQTSLPGFFGSPLQGCMYHRLSASSRLPNRGGPSGQ